MSNESQNPATATEQGDFGVLTQWLFKLLSVIVPVFGIVVFIKNFKIKKRLLNSIFFLALSILNLVLVVACTVSLVKSSISSPSVTSPAIQAVKSSAFNNFPGIKVGDAMEAVLTKVEWSSDKSDDGKDLVYVTGTYKLEDRNVDIKIEFGLSKDLTSFNIGDVSVNGVASDASAVTQLMQEAQKKLQK